MRYTIQIQSSDPDAETHDAEEQRILVIWKKAKDYFNIRVVASKAAKAAQAAKIAEEAKQAEEDEEVIMTAGRPMSFSLGDCKSKKKHQGFHVELVMCSDAEAREMLDELIKLCQEVDGTVEYY